MEASGQYLFKYHVHTAIVSYNRPR